MNSIAAEIVEQSKQYGDDVLGLLDIKVVLANHTGIARVYGRVKTFLEFSIGGELMKSTAVLSGKNPVWDETVVQTMQVKDLSAEVDFKVF